MLPSNQPNNMEEEIKSVVNLSDFTLTEAHMSLLKRGLKFCPTPPAPDPGAVRKDMNRFHTRLRQICFFAPKDASTDMSTSFTNLANTTPSDPMGTNKPFKHLKFKSKSKWQCPPGPPNLEAMIVCNEQNYNHRPTFKPDHRHNLSPDEKNALKELCNNKDIIIKPADKGSAVVVMRRQDYLKEGYKQLSDPKFYRKLDNEPTADFHNEIRNFLEDMYQNGEIDLTVQRYLLEDTTRTSQLYLLPKIHKNVLPPPGRPIISANGCPTERISQFVDHFLNPSNKLLRSFVKDTTHFLKLLKDLGNIPNDCILVTMDVSSLYTNIPNDEGLQAAMQTLERHRNTPDIKPTNLTLVKLLEMVLKMNNFQFNGVNFLQVGGTAMGTKVAPSYAVNYMGAFEHKHVYTYRLQPVLYLRYIDDIFMVWQHGESELKTFFEHMNTCSEHIKFTTEHSTEEIAFLDTKVKIEQSSITTDLYTKPTDSHNYLFYNSAHPQRCKDSIPYSQFLRIRRICTSKSDFDKHVINLCSHFLRRNYPLKLLQEAAALARNKDRDTLLNPTQTVGAATEEEQIFLISTYHPHDNALQQIVHRNWDILGRNQTTEKLHQHKLVCGYRRPKNLRDILCKAAVSRLKEDEEVDPFHVETPPAPTVLVAKPVGNKQPPVLRQRSLLEFTTGTQENTTRPSTSTESLGTSTPGPSKHMGTKLSERGYPFCDRNGCRYCRLLNKTGTITSKTTGVKHNCMTKVSCRSSNLIYAITCTKCGEQYVGQTLLRLKDRFVKHFQDIDNARQDKVIGRHFSQRNHNGYFDMALTVLEFIKKPPRSPEAITIRCRVENNWTHTLRTLAPQGLNQENPKEFHSHRKS